jgi:hypothetical protein
MTVVTLLTDFGLKDGNAGIMKGVIWNIAPSVQIADISHSIQPQNIIEAALVLSHSAPHFPPETVHTIVVDPGVGTSRRPIAARIGSQLFVCPDNGVLTLLLTHAHENGWSVESVRLDNSKYWLPEVSNVFHGRDIFAPVAAYIANGVSLKSFGPTITDLVELRIPTPVATSSGWNGEVIHIDHFGNIITNIFKQHISGREKNAKINYNQLEISGLVKTFGDRLPGEIIALYGSPDCLMISMVNGNAAKKLGAKIEDKVNLIIQ